MGHKLILQRQPRGRSARLIHYQQRLPGRRAALASGVACGLTGAFAGRPRPVRRPLHRGQPHRRFSRLRRPRSEALAEYRRTYAPHASPMSGATPELKAADLAGSFEAAWQHWRVPAPAQQGRPGMPPVRRGVIACWLQSLSADDPTLKELHSALKNEAAQDSVASKMNQSAADVAWRPQRPRRQWRE